MGHKHDDEDDDEDEELAQESDRPRRHDRGHSARTQVLAAIGLIAIGAIVVPALWGLVAEAPNLRRYMRMLRM
jgi:hypothetical protein